MMTNPNIGLNKKLKRWRAYILLNNQPTIELGVFITETAMEAWKTACRENEIYGEEGDNIFIKEDYGTTK